MAPQTTFRLSSQNKKEKLEGSGGGQGYAAPAMEHRHRVREVTGERCRVEQ